mmetsp:Transcript_63179/g.142474  ORF Transcript_63179/g.142474 Transcript_63179/m.142474 type:complete len:232 (-) Transcript_63179:350-1045(-)
MRGACTRLPPPVRGLCGEKPPSRARIGAALFGGYLHNVQGIAERVGLGLDEPLGNVLELRAPLLRRGRQRKPRPSSGCRRGTGCVGRRGRTRNIRWRRRGGRHESRATGRGPEAFPLQEPLGLAVQVPGILRPGAPGRRGSGLSVGLSVELLGWRHRGPLPPPRHICWLLGRGDDGASGMPSRHRDGLGTVPRGLLVQSSIELFPVDFRDHKFASPALDNGLLLFGDIACP